MIRISCRHVALSEIEDLRATNEYEKMVRPLDYEFDLVRNSIYSVLGILTRLGTPWLYVVETRGDRALQLVPGVLFDFDWAQIPEDSLVRLAGREDIELVPASLANIERWFEKYVSEDPNVVAFVNQEIDRLR
jgi:hypothetical protein